MLQTVKFPFVRFESSVIEKKDAQGHSLFEPVYYAYITPAGSNGKNEVMKVASEWIQELKVKGQTRGQFDENASEYERWYERFSKAFEQYKAGEEMTVLGSPLRSCPAFTKVEVAQAQNCRILTVEDLASCNEEALQHMGMGGRTMKMKAQKYLEDKESGGLAQENEALRIRLADLEEKVEAMISAGIADPDKPKRGRPRLTEAA